VFVAFDQLEAFGHFLQQKLSRRFKEILSVS